MTCVLRVTHKEATIVTWAIMTYLLIDTDNTREIMTYEPVDIIYFTLRTGNYKFKCYQRSYGILGKPLVLYCTICNISLTNLKFTCKFFTVINVILIILTSFFDTRFMAGFGGFSTEPPLLLLMLKGFGVWRLSLSFH